MNETIRIDISGTKPDRGWASISHVPAIEATPGLELTAVGARWSGVLGSIRLVSPIRCGGWSMMWSLSTTNGC